MRVPLVTWWWRFSWPLVYVPPIRLNLARSTTDCFFLLFRSPSLSHPLTALLMMKQNKNYGVLTPDVQAQISMMAIVGALSGQLFFGVLGDEVHWKKEIRLCPFTFFF